MVHWWMYSWMNRLIEWWTEMINRRKEQSMEGPIREQRWRQTDWEGMGKEEELKEYYEE